MIGFELKYFGQQLDLTDESTVRKYIFNDWTFVHILHRVKLLILSLHASFLVHDRSLPFSLSMSLLLEGCFGIQFCGLSLVFDPLGPEVAGPASPKPRDTYVIREFFRRSSLSAVSLYIFHAIVMNVVVRVTSYVATSEGDTYMFFEPIWTHAEWLGDLIFGITGVIYFILWEVILDLWFTRAKGIGTTEWMMGAGANLIWTICSHTCCRAAQHKQLEDASEAEDDGEQEKDA